MTPSTTPRRPLRPDGARVWVALCVLLGLASVAVAFTGAQASLVWRAASWMHHPWVLWTASLVHLSLAHLLVNLAALAVLAVLGAFVQAGRAATLALLLAWPLGTLALSCWPQVGGYSGMSGLLMSMAGVLWAHTTLRPATKPLSFLLFTVLALKLLSEHAWSQPIAFDPEWGFNVVYAAHLAGALAGAACGLLFEAIGRVLRPASNGTQ